MKNVLRNFLFIGFVFCILSLAIVLDSNIRTYKAISILNILTLFAYYFLLNHSIYFHSEKFNSTKLFKIVFLFSLFFLIVYKILYFNHHGDFFSIGSIDAINYHYAAINRMKYTISETLYYFLKIYNYDDLGALIYVVLVYKIFPSTLLLDFINLIIGSFSAVILFKIANYYMPPRYSFLCALSYACSSFVIQFESSGLKEILFSFIVLICFLFYVKYIHHKNSRHLLYLSPFAISIFLFRPAVLAFLLISMGLGLFFVSKNRKINLVLVLLLLVAAAYTISTFSNLINTYSSFEKAVLFREDAVSLAGEKTAIYAAIVSGLFGPLPTFLPYAEKEINSIYSVGLLFRVLLSIPFWFCFSYILKKKIYALLPFMFMIILEMASLIFIMESYELRYHLLHLPFLYMLAFFYIYRINDFGQHRKIIISKKMINYFTIVLFLLVFYWNMRYLLI